MVNPLLNFYRSVSISEYTDWVKDVDVVEWVAALKFCRSHDFYAHELILRAVMQDRLTMN